MKSYTSEGFVISKKDYGEPDKIVNIYSKDLGKISMMVKGVRKISSRKKGHLDSFNKIKFSAVLGKSMDIVTEAQHIDDYREIKSSLRRISLAYYIFELIAKISTDREQNIEVYWLIDKYMDKLKTTNLLKKLKEEFITELLILLGFWPENKAVMDYDSLVSEIVERNINSLRVGKIISY